MRVVNFAGELDMTVVRSALSGLNILKVEVPKKELTKATRRGATVIRRQAIENMRGHDDPKTPERRIYKNVVVQSAPRYGKAVNGVVMRVGVLGGARQYGDTVENRQKGRVGKSYKTGGSKGNPGGDTWYWRFLEFGAPSIGLSAKQPMLNALRSKAQQAVDELATVFKADLDKRIATLSQKGIA